MKSQRFYIDSRNLRKIAIADDFGSTYHATYMPSPDTRRATAFDSSNPSSERDLAMRKFVPLTAVVALGVCAALAVAGGTTAGSLKPKRPTSHPAPPSTTPCPPSSQPHDPPSTRPHHPPTTGPSTKPHHPPTTGPSTRPGHGHGHHH